MKPPTVNRKSVQFETWDPERERRDIDGRFNATVLAWLRHQHGANLQEGKTQPIQGWVDKAAYDVVNAVVAIVDPQTRQVIVKRCGDYAPYKGPQHPRPTVHAEQIALAKIKAWLKAHPEVKVARMALKVMVNQAPCGSDKQNCAGELAKFASSNGLVYDSKSQDSLWKVPKRLQPELAQFSSKEDIAKAPRRRQVRSEHELEYELNF